MRVSITPASQRSKLSGSKFRYTIINTIERTRKIIGVNDTVVVLLFLFKYDSKKRTQIMVNAIIITMNKIVENFIYSPFCSLYFFINIFAVSKSS